MLKCKFAGVLLALVGFSMAASDTDSSETESGYSAVTSKRYSNYIGIAAGLTSGYGLSYKRWFDKWGIQLTLFPWYEEESYSDKSGDDYYYDRDSGYSNNG
ncbi:MAG TPA: hypothetical protein VHO70_10675, partial [Chitinispirillaceae bacterium]|nr:hypothetical protein [Chitinispirillaceae bacterium]